MKKDEGSSMLDERIDAKLLSSHIHFLYGEITESNIMDAIKWITYENIMPEKKELTLFINSDGGNLQDAFALIEVMQKSKHVIRTVGIGSICSAAFLIFATGTKGYREIGATTSIMCHQFSDDYTGKYHDIKAAAKENELVNARMVDLLASVTDLQPRAIKTKLLPPSDVWFTAEEIVELGVADKIF